MEEEYDEILKNDIVDFVSFGYYGSMLASADPEVMLSISLLICFRH